MRFFSEPFRLPAGVGLLLAAGFAAVSIGGYFAAADTLQEQLTGQTLPLTADAAHAEIHAALASPAALVSALGGNRALHEELAAAEPDEARIVQALAEFRQASGAAATYLVSERNRKRYDADGNVRPVDAGAEQDRWFIESMKATPDLLTRLDAGPSGAPTLQARFRVRDAAGAVLGVAGIDMRGDALAARLDASRARSGGRLFFVDASGTVLIGGAGEPQLRGPITALPGLRDIAGTVRQAGDKPVRLEYRANGDPMMVEARYIPELGLHMVVERNASTLLHPLQQALTASLATGAVVSLLALLMLVLSVSRYRRQLARMAGTDSLTGLLNRQAFEIVLRQSVTESERNGRPLSAILFDVDFLRQVNDSHGLSAGDNVLRKLAQLAKDTVRDSDIMARWGGEEFVILLKECPLEQAVTIAEKLREAVDRHDFSTIARDRHITISLGVAQCGLQEQASLFFLRADEAMRRAKVNGRNRLQVAPADTYAKLAVV